MEIQAALNTLGYEAGAVDGVIGRGTRKAIRTFQLEIEGDPTGHLTGKQKIILLDRAEVANVSPGDTDTDARAPKSTDQDAETTERTTDTDTDTGADRDWTKVQEALNALGYPAGRESGDLTSQTREAAKAFQIDISHEPTGILTASEQDILFDDAADLASVETDSDDDEEEAVDVVEADNDNEEDEQVSLLGSDGKPDEAKDADTSLTNTLALKEYRSVSSISDPLKQLEAVRNARRSPPDFVDDLSATESLARDSQLTQLEADVKHELLTPIMEKAESAPVSLTGVRRIASLQQNAESVFAVIGPKESKSYRASLETRQNKILAALVSDQVSEMKGYPQTLDGLKQSSQWHKQFMSDYSDFSDQPLVVDAIKTFKADRSDRLAAMFPSFEEDVASLDNPGKDAPDVLDDYLSWEGDEDLPIALEYKFLAAKHE